MCPWLQGFCSTPSAARGRASLPKREGIVSESLTNPQLHPEDSNLSIQDCPQDQKKRDQTGADAAYRDKPESQGGLHIQPQALLLLGSLPIRTHLLLTVDPGAGDFATQTRGSSVSSLHAGVGNFFMSLGGIGQHGCLSSVLPGWKSGDDLASKGLSSPVQSPRPGAAVACGGSEGEDVEGGSWTAMHPSPRRWLRE